MNKPAKVGQNKQKKKKILEQLSVRQENECWIEWYLWYTVNVEFMNSNFQLYD